MIRGFRDLVAALVALCVIAYAAPADAQSPRYPAPPEDFDEESEQHSTLWERVVNPNRDIYDARVARAKELLNQRDDRADIEAAELLRDAIELAPDNPLAHWVMGALNEQRDQWRACADSYGEVFALDPSYRPAYIPVALRSSRKPMWALDFSLARCYAHAGDYERAISHHKRILSRGVTSESNVYRHLGEAYMALGRLGEAIDALRAAIKLAPGNWRISLALAVAYDRDEKAARARTHLKSALRFDRNLRQLESPRTSFLIAADRYYYLGLAHTGSGSAEWAIAYFRQYIHLTGGGPWSKRVRDHIADMVREPLSGKRITMSGTDSLNKAKVAEAIATVSRELQACMEPVPGLLLDVSITSLGKPGRSRRSDTRRVRTVGSRVPPAAGVKARIAHSFATKPDKAALAQQCVEAIAEQIPLPEPPGGTGRYVTVKFPLIAR